MDRRARTLTGIAERLYDDPRFLAAFRRDPDKALARYQLSAEEAEAIIDGDAERLEALGMDIDALIEPVPSFAARRRRNRERFMAEKQDFEPIDLLESDPR
jgi:hypothetical protein